MLLVIIIYVAVSEIRFACKSKLVLSVRKDLLAPLFVLLLFLDTLAISFFFHSVFSVEHYIKFQQWSNTVPNN